MFYKIFANFKRIDWILFFNVVFLVLIGLAAIYSTTMNVENADLYRFLKQLIFFGIGVFFLFFFAFFDYRHLANFYKFFFFLSLIALLTVLIFGHSIRGAKAWVGFGNLLFQPVEFVKIGLIIFLSKYLSDHGKEFVFLKHLFVTGGAVLLLLILIALQPDMGSGLIFFGIWLGMIFFTNIPKRYLAYLLVFLAFIGVMTWFFGLQGYQKERIINLMNPGRYPLGTGYNVSQSLVAVGSGQFFGRGLGLGSQSQLNFLPEQQTDFIFSVIAEELGFVGTTLVLFFFGLFFYRLLKIMKNSYDNFGNYLLLGFMLSFLIQFLMNIGMNIGLMPVAGVPLPFLSLGGSSLLASLVVVGIIESIIRINKESYF
jgi:rod shape determining protein RodA